MSLECALPRKLLESFQWRHPSSYRHQWRYWGCVTVFFLMHSPHSTFSDFHLWFFFLLTLLLILPSYPIFSCIFRKLTIDRIIYPNLSSAFHLHLKLPPWKSLTLLEKHDLMTHLSSYCFWWCICIGILLDRWLHVFDVHSLGALYDYLHDCLEFCVFPIWILRFCGIFFYSGAFTVVYKMGYGHNILM